MINKLLLEGLHRNLEYASGAKANLDGRLCFDVMRSELASSQRSSYDKGCAKLLTCEGGWTAAVAAERGYEVDPSCSLCGGPLDPPWHRLVECPCVEDKRRSTIPADVLSILRDAPTGEQKRAAITGLFQHPADDAARPLELPSGHVISLDWLTPQVYQQLDDLPSC